MRALSTQTVDSHLASFAPHRGQGVLIEAGTVHSFGDGVVVFEVQENSDVTFRLYDWDHIDPKTGHPRPLQIEQALACVDFIQGAGRPSCRGGSDAARDARAALRLAAFPIVASQGAAPFAVGAADEPRVLVCIEGSGNVEHDGADFAMEKGAVVLLPAAVGACRFRPERPGHPVGNRCSRTPP